METKTYRVRSMREAIDLIKEDLGPEASILYSRRIASRWRTLLGQSEILEVVASPDADVPSRLSPAETSASSTNESSESKPLPERESVAAFESESGEPGYEDQIAIGGTSNEFPRLWERESLHDRHDDQTGLDLSDVEETATLERWLANSDFPPEVIQQIFDGVSQLEGGAEEELSMRVTSGGSLTRSQVGRLLARQLNVAHGLRVEPEAEGPKVIAMVGSTGVGKTTTLAKLAAGYHIHQKLQVGLITVDTFRIAAVEQLRTYARILELPMEIVTTAAEMQSACERLRSMDVILIDTYGASPKDRQHLDELRQILRAARPHEVALVASCMSSANGMTRAIDAYQSVGATSLVISKLDEADVLGHLWAPIRDSQLPVRYVTTGQNVPDDIEAADAFRMAAAMLGVGECQRFLSVEEAYHA